MNTMQNLTLLLVLLIASVSARDLSTGTAKVSETTEEYGNGAGASGGAGWVSDFAQEGCDCTCDCPEENPDCTCACDWCGDEVDQATMKKRRKQRRRRLGTFPAPNSLYF